VDRHHRVLAETGIHKALSESPLDLLRDVTLVRIAPRAVSRAGAEVWAQLELALPGAMKDRVALQMVEDAEASGALRPGGVIVESSSGAMAEGLARVGALKGYRLQSGNSVIPGNLKYDVIDEVHWVSDGEAFAACRELARRTGIFAGGSSGAAYLVASWVAERFDPGAQVAVICPDRGDRYVGTVYSRSVPRGEGTGGTGGGRRAATAALRDRRRRAVELGGAAARRTRALLRGRRQHLHRDRRGDRPHRCRRRLSRGDGRHPGCRVTRASRAYAHSIPAAAASSAATTVQNDASGPFRHISAAPSAGACHSARPRRQRSIVRYRLPAVCSTIAGRMEFVIDVMVP
jgi:hypothetical protein